MGKYYLNETKQGYKIAEWYTYKKAPYGLIVLVKDREIGLSVGVMI